MLSYGKIVQVSGPVVDCEFQEGQLPKIREALRVQVEDEVRTMEVAQHMDEHTVRCIMLAPSEGLSRGMTVEGPGAASVFPSATRPWGACSTSWVTRLTAARRFRHPPKNGASTAKRRPLPSKARS